jgi:Flp pilus assembly protein TadD
VNSTNSLGWYYSAKAEYELRLAQGETFQPVHDDLRKALQLSPEDGRLHLLLGKVLAAEKRYTEAERPLRTAARLERDDPAPHYQLARTLQKLGKPVEARQAMEAYQRAKPHQKEREFRTLLVQIR